MEATESAGMANDARDDTTGLYQQKYPDEEFIEAVRELGPLAGSSDIADYVGCNHITANERLRSLEENGHVEHISRAGANLWSVSDGEGEDE